MNPPMNLHNELLEALNNGIHEEWVWSEPEDDEHCEDVYNHDEIVKNSERVALKFAIEQLQDFKNFHSLNTSDGDNAEFDAEYFNLELVDRIDKLKSQESKLR